MFSLSLLQENLAFNKPTKMIGGPPWYPSSNAVDGNSQTTFRSCTHTPKDADFQNPWLRVDLGRVEPVNEVYIVNRGDCCGERLNPFEIRVGKTKLYEALLEIIVRYKPQGMNRLKFSNRTYYKYFHPFDEKPTYLLTRNDTSQSLITTEYILFKP